MKFARVASPVAGSQPGNAPGGEGGVREPYLMPDAAELDRFARGAAALGLPEITAMLPAATGS